MSEETTTVDAVKKEKVPSSHLTLSIVTLFVSLIVPLRLFLVPFSIVALYFSIKTRRLIKKDAEGNFEQAKKYSKRALVTALCVLIFVILFTVVLIVLGAQGPVKHELNSLYRRNMMTNLYARLDAYRSKFGTYPNDGEGVRALYPLYKEGFISRKELESILQPPGVEFDKFSEKPTEQEFDAFHIGWSYNANARPGSEDPLIGYQGIKDGKLHLLTTNRSIMPLSERDAFIILANGRQLRLPTKVRTGELLVPDYKISLDCLKD